MKLIPKKPITITLEWDEIEWLAKCGECYRGGKTPALAVKGLMAELLVDYRAFALEPDEKLGKSARELKAHYLETFRLED